jgi:dihydrofolate reductase
MVKLKLQMQLSIDGYVASPNGQLDWAVWDWDQGLKDYVEGITSDVDCIVLGRKLAQGFIPYWASHPNEEGAGFMNAAKKVVFSKSLKESEWANTSIAKGNLIQEIETLKSENGKNLIVYGGAEFVTSLIENDLIDEYNLFINPSVIGQGLGIFGIGNTKYLRASTTRLFDCGIVLVKYLKS